MLLGSPTPQRQDARPARAENLAKMLKDKERMAPPLSEECRSAPDATGLHERSGQRRFRKRIVAGEAGPNFIVYNSSNAVSPLQLAVTRR